MPFCAVSRRTILPTLSYVPVVRRNATVLLTEVQAFRSLPIIMNKYETSWIHIYHPSELDDTKVISSSSGLTNVQYNSLQV